MNETEALARIAALLAPIEQHAREEGYELGEGSRVREMRAILADVVPAAPPINSEDAL